MNKLDEEMVVRVESVLIQFFEDLFRDRLGAENGGKDERVKVFLLIKKHLAFFFETQTQMTLHLEIFTQIDGCHPLLLEKWTLSLSFPPEESLIEHLIDLAALQSIKKLSTTLPKLPFPVLDINISQVSLKPWPKSPKTLTRLPKVPIKVQISPICLEVFCEYLSETGLPEIKMQELGIRPRVSSIEIGDFNYIDLEVSGADAPMVCLDQMIVASKNCCNYLELTTNKCKHEHLSIGFTPLSHTICSENASYENESECFGKVFEVFGENLLTEDAEISVYKIICDRMNKNQLFDDAPEVSLDQLKESLWKMKATLDLL